MSQPPIWRRRSLNGSRELTDLSLDNSQGSTASASAAPVFKPYRKPEPAAQASEPPVPQKDVAPRPSSPNRELPPKLPAKDGSIMGHGLSKIEDLKNKFHKQRRSNDSVSSVKKGQPAPMVNRPPTPEYQKEEAKAAPIKTFVSTVSPNSSPEPARDKSSASANSTRQVPLADRSNTETNPSARPILPPIDTTTPALQPAKSLPNLQSKFMRTSHEPLPPVSAIPSSGRNSPAFDSVPRGRQSGASVGYHSRNNSARPSSRGSMRPSGPARFPPSDSDPRLVRSSTGDLMYKGRDGTLYGEMKDLPNPDPSATRFPRSQSELPDSGAIFKAASLKPSHFHCYQKHKNMLRRPNKRYPLACQTCQKHDTEDRFSCSFCYVRMCESCLSTFEAKNRDLKALTDEMSPDGALSLTSPTRRGSALGLQINF